MISLKPPRMSFMQSIRFFPSKLGEETYIYIKDELKKIGKKNLLYNVYKRGFCHVVVCARASKKKRGRTSS
jgi:hypothetical protein